MVDLINFRETAYGINWIGGWVGYRDCMGDLVDRKLFGPPEI